MTRMYQEFKDQGKVRDEENVINVIGRNIDISFLEILSERGFKGYLTNKVVCKGSCWIYGTQVQNAECNRLEK
ncbi:predicted protein [Sclerotinia sclerotiorum 1980 UF-70]|uniref:Uncharacterized protein n=1 Tax=Sclerotinia sclerotiorum (strain ATCC 18683 / 1980 / Ss-1) TaxID=665079 RepID=A7E487_SCLS1|nr:predicted protein [Sclerotinia sclerotiorum 1980 UF-70]EDN90709.1 predicted protein [Sclerotinia sclerotiorum 1980 UF-70]